MHKNIAVKLHNISKVYKLYDKPIDRLKEALTPLNKQYHRDFFALKNINLEIKKGEVLGIVGINGAGKSTLLKIISGVLTPSTGRITINGKLNAILELSAGLKPEMTGRQNIKLNLQISGIRKDVTQLTKEIIEFADIGEHIDQPVKTYSSGMKARLGFGLATSTDPDILIVDEVLAVGDVLFKRKCYNRIENLFKNGKTVIFVSHSSQSVIEFCSTAILLYDKEIILKDTPKKVTDFYQKLVFSKDKQEVLKYLETSRLFIDEEKNNLRISGKKYKGTSIALETEFLSNFSISPRFINPEIATFSDIIIYNNVSKKVNILQSNHKYQISFNIKFHKSISSVRIGIQIQTLKGLVVCGTNTSDYNQVVYDVSKDELYYITLSFDALLVAGDYIIRAIATNDEELSIVEDAYIFRIASSRRRTAGFIYLNQVLDVCKEKKSN